MPRYPNGFIPASELVTIEGNHKATRGTAARWEALKADVKAHEGITLRITGGENAYRSYAGQVFARKQACAAGRCNDAAVPGFSSHGGSLNGRDSGAIDVSNWALLGKAKFYAYCRKHGFEPGYFSWEPWHIIDWAPYTVPASGGGGAEPFPTPEEEEEEEMKASYVWWVTTLGKQMNLVYAVAGNGLYDLWESNDGGYNTGVVGQYDLAGPGFKISQSHGDQLVARCNKKIASS